MGDPDLYNDEQILMRTPGVYVKSIPFEGILTDRRIILVDRAKNILPTKEIGYATIQNVETGENAIRDQLLTLTVLTETGETRQMIITFSQREGGNRARQRDEWSRIIQQGMTAFSGQRRTDPSAGSSQRVQVKRGTESRAPSPAPVPAEPGMAAPLAGDTVFCTRCGNRVPSDSTFCNRCGTPIVAPGTVARQPAPERRPVSPPPVSEPVYEQPAQRVQSEPPRAARPPVSSRQPAPVQKPAKKGFLAGLLSPKTKKPAEPKPRAPPVERRPRRSLMPGRNVLIAGVVIIVIIAVIAIGAVFVYPMLSSSLAGGDSPSSGGSLFGGSSSTTLSNTGVASITVVETPPPTVPVTGVWVMIDYIGSYKGTYGKTTDLQKVEDSGARLYEVVNASGTIQATLEKKDSSTKHKLLVSIYKDGKLLKEGSTSVSYGKVTISADAGAGAVAPTSSAGTNTTATANVTATTKTTTAVTTVKTTAAT
jgi:hypothetical protein